MATKQARKTLDYHRLDPCKTNLVTLPCGNDRYQCAYCHKEFKFPMNPGSKRIYGRCRPTERGWQAHKAHEAAEAAKRADESARHLGTWTAGPTACSGCGKTTIKVVTGHPLDEFLHLKRDDGLDLYACPGNCREGDLDRGGDA